MLLIQYLPPANVILGMTAANKAAVLEQLAEAAAAHLGLAQEQVLGAIQDRERLGSTALGRGVALPHAELAGADHPIVIFARLTRAVDFDARDAQPVDLVFVVLWPATIRKGLLSVMSDICRTLRDPQVLRRLRGAETPEQVVDLIHRSAPSDTEPE